MGSPANSIAFGPGPLGFELGESRRVPWACYVTLAFPHLINVDGRRAGFCYWIRAFRSIF